MRNLTSFIWAEIHQALFSRFCLISKATVTKTAFFIFLFQDVEQNVFLFQDVEQNVEQIYVGSITRYFCL